MKYQLTIDEHQLLMIARAVEDYSRTLGGQAEMTHASMFADADAQDVRECLLGYNQLMNPNGEKYGWSGYGCKNEHKRKEIAASFYLYHEILNFYYTERHIDNVYSDGTLTCENSGNPIVIKNVTNEQTSF